MVEASTALDWQEVYARLEQTRQRLEASSVLPPAEVRRLLRERAQALARPLVEPPTVIDVLDLAVFVLAEVRYGIEAAYVLEVTPLRELTPVPCTPPHILGVVNHRGRLLPILDLRKLFALAAHNVTAESRIVAVEVGGMTFGILADAMLGTIRVGVHEVMPLPGTLLHDHQAFLQGITGEIVAVLDLEALVRDPRLTVNEDVD
jgi:purine-binding chemotaxis protein CheW